MVLEPANEVRFFSLKSEVSKCTITLSIGVKCSLHDPVCEVKYSLFTRKTCVIDHKE